MLLFFPNITLCDAGCEDKGVNEKFEAICECSFSDILNNDLLNNPFTGELLDTLKEINIEVVKCYKDLFKLEYFKKNTGSIIILFLIVIQIFFNIIYYLITVSAIHGFTLRLINSYYYYLNKNINENNKVSDDNINKLIKIDGIDNKMKKHFIKRKKNKKNSTKKKNNDLSPKSSKNSLSSRIKLNVLEQNNKKVKDDSISIKLKKNK